jgi:hypothetical protein
MISSENNVYLFNEKFENEMSFNVDQPILMCSCPNNLIFLLLNNNSILSVDHTGKKSKLVYQQILFQFQYF